MEFISKNFTLMPGDIIITGTPGDVVEINIEKIGTLNNNIIDERTIQ